MTNGIDREWGQELCTIIVEPDPRLQQLRRVDECLSRLSVWQQHLLVTPFALITAVLTVWNSAVPLADPNLLLLTPFGP
jgi:hypothetical protein